MVPSGLLRRLLEHDDFLFSHGKKVVVFRGTDELHPPEVDEAPDLVEGDLERGILGNEDLTLQGSRLVLEGHRNLVKPPASGPASGVFALFERLQVADGVLGDDDLRLFLLDAEEGVKDQDLRLADLAWRKGRGLVIAVNKMDLTPRLSAEQCHEQIANLLPQWPPVPLVQISAKTGRGIPTLIRALNQVLDAFEKRLGTSDLNRLVETAVDDNPPPLSARKRPMRILYATQARTSPPEVALFTSGSEELPESWQRFLVHRLREAAGWVGVPVRLRIRTKKGRNPFVDD